MSMIPDRPNTAAPTHPAWCSPDLCETDAFAVHHRQTPATMATAEQVEVAIGLYRMDEHGQPVHPADHVVELVVTDRSAAQPPSIRLLLAPDEVETLVGPLLHRSVLVTGERQRAVIR